MSPRSLGFSQFVGSLSNSMHVLMKHCWPAAHCQSHCCLDDWSIEGLRAFVMPPPPPFRHHPPLVPNRHPLPLLRRLVSNLRHRHPRAPDAAKAGTSLYRHFGERPKQRPRTSHVDFFQRCIHREQLGPSPVTYHSSEAGSFPRQRLRWLNSSCSTSFLSIVSVSNLSRAKGGGGLASGSVDQRRAEPSRSYCPLRPLIMRRIARDGFTGMEIE